MFRPRRFHSEPSRWPTLSRRRKILSLIAIAAIVVAVAAYHVMTGQPQGGPCRRASDCSKLFQAACAFDGGGGYCTSTCDSDGDCAGGYTCGLQKAHRKKVTRERQVCVRPGAATDAMPAE